MSTFEVNVVRIDDIYDHPNADRLSIVLIGGYEAITMKNEDGSHRFVKGEPVVYVPEQAVVPEHLLKQFGFWDETKGKGMLAGSKGNRVKAIRLRDHLSQGLVWKTANALGMQDVVLLNGDIDGSFNIGDNVAEFFGIVKYEVPVPAQFSGHADSIPEAILHYDIENQQKFPTLITEGEEVVITEKLHGTHFRMTVIPGLDNDKLFGGDVAICSKGLGGKGLVFSDTPENRESNTYVKAALTQIADLESPAGQNKFGDNMYDTITILDAFRRTATQMFPGKRVSMLGEIFGKGIQDLTYGFEKPEYRAFDVHVEGQGWLDEADKAEFFRLANVTRVPVLFRGPFNLEDAQALRDGKCEYNAGFCIKEGVVVTVVGEQTPRRIGGHNLRPFVKMVSPAYLLRKGDVTEFN